MQTIGERIDRVSTEKGVVVADLARKANISRQSIYKILDNKVKDPGGATMLRLADALGVSVRWLISGEGDARSEAPSQPTRPDRATLRSALTIVEEVLAELQLTYSAKDKADIVLGCYAALEAGQAATAAEVFVKAFLEAQKTTP